MKTHTSTELFLYCSGGERSVKRVRIALEMEASKEELRDVVRFFVADSAEMHHKSESPGILPGRIILLIDKPVPILPIW